LIAKFGHVAAANAKRALTESIEETATLNVQILRPKGSAGDGFKLRAEMGLDANPKLYAAIRVSVPIILKSHFSAFALVEHCSLRSECIGFGT
jgi:hypothetical protein